MGNFGLNRVGPVLAIGYQERNWKTWSLSFSENMEATEFVLLGIGPGEHVIRECFGFTRLSFFYICDFVEHERWCRFNVWLYLSLEWTQTDILILIYIP
jgi:hypothetical protein